MIAKNAMIVHYNALSLDRTCEHFINNVSRIFCRNDPASILKIVVVLHVLNMIFSQFHNKIYLRFWEVLLLNQQKEDEKRKHECFLCHVTTVNFQLLICTGCLQYFQIHLQTSAISSVDFCAYSSTLPHSGM